MLVRFTPSQQEGNVIVATTFWLAQETGKSSVTLAVMVRNDTVSDVAWL